MASLPAGTVTFLFADIEGSTSLLEQLGDQYANVQADCRRLLRSAIEERGGQEVDSQGDALFVVFQSARNALAAAVAAQRNILRYPWPDGVSIGVRMGLHTGEALGVEPGYVGMDVHRASRICGAGHGGQILLSHTAHDLVADAPPAGVTFRSLGEHRLKDLTRPLQLFQVVATDLPREFPSLRSLDAFPNNLPVHLTSFIGREREKAELVRALLATRLLTVTGVGGTGKTRLALEVAADLLEHYGDGTWWVDLASLADPVLVPQSVALALGIREQRGRPVMETLLHYLRTRRLLLIVDNCEHLLVACAQMANALLRGCPQLRILATSREAFGIAGEVLYPVPPLSTPDPQRLPPIEQLTHYEAVRLFAERATSVLPSFKVTNLNAQALAQVCSQLDGIPLAIELAAARVKALSAEQIAARLADRFRLLTGGSRTALARYQSLQATLDWSYALLSEKEQKVLNRLAVFAGGFTPEAAEAICSCDSVGKSEILDLLTRLVDKSLLVAEEQEGQVRYRLLEIVRHYAQDRLDALDEVASTRARHRDFFLALAEMAKPYLLAGLQQEAWVNRLRTEYGNLRQALDWSAKDANGLDVHLRLVVALTRFWVIHSDFTEGRGWLEGALARNKIPPRRRAELVLDAGYLVWHQGDFVYATSLSEEAHKLGKEVKDKRVIARALNVLGLVAREQGDYGRAVALGEESLSLFREFNDKRAIAIGLHNLGLVALYEGDYARAVALHQESLGLLRELGDLWGIAIALHNLGLAARHQGDYARATAFHKESLVLTRPLGAKHRIAMALEGFAGLAAAQNNHGRAVCLFAAADMLRESIATPRSSAEGIEHERTTRAVRAALSESVFQEFWAEGYAMTLEQAINYALSDT